jgi:hypothetical protein
MEIYAHDHGIAGLVMPEELSKIICDYARVKKPDDLAVGEGENACAICFGKRQIKGGCKKVKDKRYCKGCYYAYGGGGFGNDNTYEEYPECVKCKGLGKEYCCNKTKGYSNCPLCFVCYKEEKDKIYAYKNTNKCECGSFKSPSFPTCFKCKDTSIPPRDKLKKVIEGLIVDWEKSRMCQFD